MKATEKQGKTAIIVGATGLVGSHLVKLLIEDSDYTKILVFTRRKTGVNSNKIEERIVDFDRIDQFSGLVRGDVLFSALGTTLNQAGSKAAQNKVDFTYQLDFARLAARNKIPCYVLVSSAGASSRSKLFYLKMKGQLDDEVFKLNFRSIAIIRPASLVGKREHPRKGEEISIKVTNFMAKLIPLLKKYRPIHAQTVARAMINSVKSNLARDKMIFEYDEVHNLAGE